ncbi:nuclease SbcCD subunit D [Nocardioides psychrotolerans]|uniref:Nuclease SbcCD subunit D n=1 Tax=Nocardioides psychrotolerans TaxID=1005945 RepID=A0A1I3JI70_9ACTN|nr:exonuclease SbcCD subunit D [Nocardioides psychrotolerans]GEP38144.1 nuclease SbcCD subunit D [Nocardioides psychrotolerans]SFI59951.1 Exodeoxyribonuclease I subunit D [Nocardioides psychrotolerans]
MRILHTSDWHLGRSFHREGMLAHQATYLDHLLEVVESERVDLVVVSGDVYDRALPPVDAVLLADDALVRLAASRASVVLTSGNHDSARRLGFSSRLIDAAGVHIRTDASGVGTPVVLDDEHGQVAVYGVPYLDPSALVEPWSLPGRSHEAALGEAMRRVRRDLSARGGVRSVVLAHAFVTGAQPSDSERDISVGGVSMVPTSVFDGVDYTALGHLHGRQTLADRVRYSGSPLAYSFSEADHLKGSWLVELDGGGFAGAHFLEAPVPRPVARLAGDLETLLADPGLCRHEQSFVEVTLTDSARPGRAMDRLRQRFPHTLVLRFAAPMSRLGSLPASQTHARSDRDIALDFMTDMRGGPPEESETVLLHRAIDACCEDSDVDTFRSDREASDLDDERSEEVD